MPRPKLLKGDVQKTQPEEEKKTPKKRTKKADAAVLEEKAVSETASVDAVENAASAKAAEVPASEDVPDVAENERIPRYDVIITSERAGYKPPKVAFGGMVQQIAFRGFANPVDEAIAESWIEVYFEPAYAAHEIFLERAYTSGEPVFKELVLRVQDKPFFCDFSSTPKRPLYWCIEIRGSRFKDPIGAFKKLFLDAFNVRVAVDVCDARPIPEHRVVSEDEKPVERKKRERGVGIAGTEVEEV